MLRLLATIFISALLLPSMAAAQTTTTPAFDIYARARVVKIVETGQENIDGALQPFQVLELEITSGPERGKKIIIDHGKLFAIAPHQLARAGETVVIAKPAGSQKENFYYITETYRAPRLLILALAFALLALITAGFKGLRALVGMGVTALVIFKLIIPAISRGHSPLLVTAGAALIILFISFYFTHGLRKRTSIAVVGTLVTFGLAILLDFLVVSGLRLFGTGTEEAFYLQFGSLVIDLRGLLMAGILLGVLGVLDDVTTTQAGTVAEISAANPALNSKDLYRRGMSVGKDHIASLINTLLLAYVGASLPLFLLFSGRAPQPWWLFFNSAFIAEEAARTLVGSAALMLSVPITTALAAWWYGRADQKTGRI